MSTSSYRQLALFADLSTDQYAVLQALFTPRYEPGGVVVFRQGEHAEFLYILIDGQVNLRYKPEDGPELTIVRVQPESVIGWSAALGGPTYTSSALCVTDCQMLAIRGQDLRRLCERDTNTGALILERLAAGVAERLSNTHQQVLALLEQGLSININKRASTGSTDAWLQAMENANQIARGGRAMEKATNASTYSDYERMQALLDKISAYIEHFHGGSVEMVSYDGRVLKVRLGGACLGCPLSPNTLHGWVEGTVRQFFPNIERVESVA